MATEKDNIHQEPEERTPRTEEGDATIIPPDKDMLTSEPKIHREHSSVNTTGPTVSEFTPPPFTGNIEEDKTDKAGPPDPADHPMANPGVRDAPPHVKKQGVEFLADKLIKGYGGVKKKLACLVTLISEKKVDKMEEQGLVKRNVILPLEGGGSITAGALIEKHNEQAEELIDKYALTEEFYDEVKPMVEEELSKRNIALTNMQMLIGTVGIDVYNFVEKVVIPLRQQHNEVIYAFKNATKAYQAAPPGFTPHYAQNQSQQSSAGSGNSQPPPEAPAPTPDPVAPAGPNEPVVGNVDTAFDDLQSGGQNFMKTEGKVILPSEFDQAEAISKAMSGKTTRIPQSLRAPVKRKKKPKRRTKKVTATIINP